jgi:hypothetical protein
VASDEELIKVAGVSKTRLIRNYFSGQTDEIQEG